MSSRDTHSSSLLLLLLLLLLLSFLLLASTLVLLLLSLFLLSSLYRGPDLAVIFSFESVLELVKTGLVWSFTEEEEESKPSRSADPFLSLEEGE
jgi:membrane protein implicated in regulation of membrane protease activity